MKTALQLAINHFDSIDDNMHLSTTQIKYILSQYLAQEKIQIIDAYEDGYESCDLDEVMEVNKKLTSGKLYYNKTYKN